MNAGIGANLPQPVMAGELLQQKVSEKRLEEPQGILSLSGCTAEPAAYKG